MKLLAGAVLLILPFQKNVASTIAPLGEWVQNVTIRAPALKEEIAHERALQSSSKAARRRAFPKIKAYLEESFVESDLDSGFLSTARIEVPLFNKTKDYLASKIEKLEEEGYGVQMQKSKSERIFEIRSVYYELQTILNSLPVLLEKREMMSGMIESEERLTRDKIKIMGDLDEIRRTLLLLNQTVAHTKSRLEVLKNKMTYLSGVHDEVLDFSELNHETVPQAPAEDMPYWIDWAVSKHPEITQLALEVEKQRIRLSMAKREWLPEVSAVSTYARDPRFAQNENQVFAGVQVKLDLWSFGANHANKNKEKAFLQELEARLENKKQLIANEVDEAFRLYGVTYSGWKAHESYFEFQKDVMESWAKRFHAGEISERERQFAWIRFLDARIELEKARREALEKEAGFYLTVGIINPEMTVAP